MKRPPRMVTYSMRYILPAALVVLVSIWLVARRTALQTIETQARTDMQKSVYYEAGVLGIKLHTLQDSLQSLAMNTILVNGLIDTLNRDRYLPAFFKSIRIPGPAGPRITLTDYRGRAIMSSHDESLALVDQDRLGMVVEKNSPWHRITADGIVFVQPVRYNGLAEGSLVLEYDGLRINAILSLPDTGHTHIVLDRTGKVILSSCESLATARTAWTEPAGTDWVTAAAPVANYPDIRLVIANASADIFALVRMIDHVMMVMMALILTVFILSVALSAWKMTVPLGGLIKTLGTIQRSDDLSVRIPESGIREITTLARSFNSMLQTLQQTTVDVDTLKQAEAHLKESLEQSRHLSARLALATSAARVGVWELDLDTQNLHWDATMAGMYGLRDGEQASTYETWESALHPEDAAAAVELLQQAITARTVFTTEFRIVRPDGGIRYIYAHGRTYRDPDGAHRRMIGVNWDISETKQTQLQLRQSEERMHLALRGADLGMWDWNVQTGEVVFNNRWAEMLGYSPEEILPHVSAWKQLLHPDDQCAVFTALEQHLSGQRDFYESEHRLRNKNGSYTWVLDRGKVVERDAGGKPFRATGTHLDITARKEAEMALTARSAELAERIRQLKCLYEISRFTEHTSLPFDELMQTIIESLPAAFQDPDNTLVRAVVDRRTYRTGVVPAFPQGITAEILAFKRTDPLTGFGKKTLGFVQVYRNSGPAGTGAPPFTREEQNLLSAVAERIGTIADREWANRIMKQNAEELYEINASLQQEKRRTELILQDIGDGVVAVDLAGRVIVANPMAERLLGVGGLDSTGKSFSDLFTNCALPASEINDLLTSELREKRTLTLTAPTTRELDIVCTCLHDEQRQAAGRILVLHDVTREKEIDRMKTDFVSAVSHELRTPLTSIKGFTATILRDPEMSENTRQEFLEIVEGETDRLTALIQDILELSRIERGRLSVPDTLFDPGTVVKRAVSTISPLAAQKNLHVDCDIPAGLPPLTGSEEKIQSVISNLLSNAIKFTVPGGNIATRVSSDGDCVLVTISDTGMGIPDHDLPRIFDRFYRVHRPGTEIPGTGLGLAICRELVQLHGGSIDAQSTEGKGSVFTVRLPLHPPARENTTAET